MDLSSEDLRRLAPTGALRVVINLGNPVLTAGTAEDPGGITIDLAREIGARLGLPLDLLCVHAARDAFAALTDGAADLAFLAIEPARAEHAVFSEPYLVIEGVYAVCPGSGLGDADAVDRPGVRVGVREGSAYDLYLTRTLQWAEVERGKEPFDVFEQQQLNVTAGIRQPLEEYARLHRLTVLEPAFMQIRQAVALPRTLDSEVARSVFTIVDDLKRSGFVEQAISRAGQSATVPAG